MVILYTDELAFTKRLSKDSNKYQNRNTIESNALTILNNQGKCLKAGEILQYVITDYYQIRSKNNRAIPVGMIYESTCYDVKRYIELLTEACNSVTEPFGLRLTSPLISVSSLQSYPVIGEIGFMPGLTLTNGKTTIE
jgi:DNA polymerase elongation subunit (family B)